MLSVRRWTRAWLAGLALLLLPVACKQEPTDPFGSSRTKDPAGHPVLGVESVPLNGSAFAVAINRDGVYYVTTVFGPVARGVLPSTDLSNQLQSGILDSQVRISPDGRTAYVNNQDAGTIEVIDVRTNVITDTIHASPSILTTGISNDGQTLYSLTDYHGIDIISTSTLQITDNIPASSVGSLLTGIAFHPTQPLMYVAARDAGVVTVVQIPENTVVTTLAVPGGRIQNVAVSRDGGPDVTVQNSQCSFSGSTTTISSNSEPWLLWTVMARAVSTAGRRESETRRVGRERCASASRPGNNAFLVPPPAELAAAISTTSPTSPLKRRVEGSLRVTSNGRPA